MTWFRPNIERMNAYTPGEQPQGGGFIKLNTNENPYPPSPRVIEALRAAVGPQVRLYPDPLAQAVRRRAAEVFGLAPENVMVGNGSDDLLTIAMRAFVDPGEAVAFPVPTYSLYRTLAEIQDARTIEPPFGDDFALPPALALAEAKLTLLANPNSPSGTVVPPAAVARLAEQVKGVLVVDEAYVDFAEENALALVRTRPNVIVLRTFSKSFSLCGLRIGLAFAPAPLIAGLMKVKDSYNVNRFAIAAADAALADIEAMRDNAAKVKRTRERLSAALTARGAFVWPSQSNFVLARFPEGAGRPVAKALYQQLKERKILVRYFDQPRLRDCLRISIGTDAEIDALLKNLTELWPAARAV